MARRTTSMNPTLNPRPARGFSLFELMLVTIVAGVIAAIALPRFAGSIARTRLERAVHRLGEDIELARRSAVASSTAKVLAFDPAAASYSVDGLFSRDLSKEPFSARMPGAAFGGNAYVTFDGYGMPTSSGVISIRSGDYLQTIAISADTGEVTVGPLTIIKTVFIEPEPIDPIIIGKTTPIIKAAGLDLTLPTDDIGGAQEFLPLEPEPLN